MKLEGILLFVGLAILIEALVNVLFVLPCFQTEDKRIPYIKFAIKLLFAESITLSTVFLAQTIMVFGYFGIVTFSYLDAGFSGIFIAGGPDLIKKIYQDIVSSREELAKLQGQTEILKEIAMKTETAKEVKVTSRNLFYEKKGKKK